MSEEDIIRKYSHSPYVEPPYIELYNFDEKEIEKYCNWVRNQYASIVKDWNVEINTYWTAKYYLATKFLFITNLLLSSYEYARDKNLKIVLPYLIYYSLLTASRSLILTSPLDKREIDFIRTHDKIINETTDIIARINKQKSEKYKETINIAKDNRELFSYKFPASGLRLINDNSEDVSKQVNLIRELSVLNSQILDVMLDKLQDKTVFEIDGECDSVMYNLFDYKGKIDNDDYYNAGYIGRKRKRPHPLNLMISEGMEEDFYLSWAPEEEDSDLFIPPEFIFDL